MATPAVTPEVPTPPPSFVAPALAVESAPPVPPPVLVEGDPSAVAPMPVEAPVAPLAIPLPSPPRSRPGLADPGPVRSAPGRSEPTAATLPEAPRLDLAAPRVAFPTVKPSPTEPSKPQEPTTSADDLDPRPPGARFAGDQPRAGLFLARPGPPPGPPADPRIPLGDRPRDPDPDDRSDDTPGPGPGHADRAGGRRALPRPLGPSTRSPTSRRCIGRRLDPNRTVLAQRAGASVASEQAVERALDWLARHQDATDGRWDGGTARFRDGTTAENDDSFTIHCPAGEVCFGECYYWEADTALTGLSLLAYLGAGYTHLDGKYTTVVGKGLDFLVKSQKADGDLRGSSVAVGMYCHSMATLALCEAYALTGDARLRPVVEKAGRFPGPFQGRRWPGLAIRSEGGERRHQHPGLGGDGAEVGQDRGDSDPTGHPGRHPWLAQEGLPGAGRRPGDL